MTALSVELLTADPAAGLRAVAALIRERAQQAAIEAPGPWVAETLESDARVLAGGGCGAGIANLGRASWPGTMDQAVHIASFAQPAVALAVADWMEDGARRFGLDPSHDVHCLRAARTYLTGEVPQ